MFEPDSDEECDDGADNGEAAACSKTCRIATCGDGIVQADVGEECVRTACCRCGDELRVPFPCKGRGFCPSCMGRRMAEGAASPPLRQ